MRWSSQNQQASPAAGLPLNQDRPVDSSIAAAPESASSASSVPQFGLRTLFVVIAAIAGQLVLWRSGWACAAFAIYVAVILLCNVGSVLLMGLLGAYNLLPWTGSPEERLDRLCRARDRLRGNGNSGRYVQIAHGLFLGTYFATAVGVIAVDNVVQGSLESRLRHDLGFTYRNESYDFDGDGIYLDHAAIESVTLGGPMDRAGFQRDDVILYDRGYGRAQLFQMLDSRRGQSVELTVIRPLATQPLLEKCPRLVLTVEVPP